MTALSERPGVVLAAEPGATARPPRGLPVGWPIGAYLAGYPVWWALGVIPLALPAAGALLGLTLLRRGRRVLVPPGFWIWLTFLVIVVVSAVMLNVVPAHTLAPTGIGRYGAYAVRLVGYAAVAVFMLFIINTPESELPRRRLLSWLSLLALWTIGLGLLSIALKGFSFRSGLQHLSPALDAALGGTGGSVTLSQLQPVLGVYAPRPAAPFAFTNAWGNSLALLLVWLLVHALASGRRTRLLTACLVVLAAVPIVYSLDRGMWIALGLAMTYVAVRLAGRGQLAALGALGLVVTLGTLAFLASPLQTLVAERIQHGHSNSIRTSLAGDTLTAADSSPLIGYGSTRKVLGSGASIAVGQTSSCRKCGNAELGSTGQYFLLLVSQGYLGVVLYVAYFLRTLWAYRRDASPVGIAGTLVVLMSLFLGIAYTALDVPLAVVFVSIALLWRNAATRAAGKGAARMVAGPPGGPVRARALDHL